MGVPTLVARLAAVSHEEINGINWFLVHRYKFRKVLGYFNSWTPSYRGSYKITVVCLSICPSAGHFSQEWLIFFLIFVTMGDNWNI